jgi:hypothetical protein
MNLIKIKSIRKIKIIMKLIKIKQKNIINNITKIKKNFIIVLNYNLLIIIST